MKWGKISLIMVKSYNSLLHILLVCIRSYQKSIVRYKFLIFLPIIWTVCIYVSKDVGPWLFFEAKRGPRARKFGKHCFKAKDCFTQL